MTLNLISDADLGDLLLALTDVAAYAEPGEVLAALADLSAAQEELERRDLRRPATVELDRVSLSRFAA